MKEKDIRRLGKALYTQHGGWRGYIPKQRLHAAEFGLDTEYYIGADGENKLLTWQLSLNDELNYLATSDMDWQHVYDQTKVMLQTQETKLKDITLIVLYCFFSTAEGQWLALDDKTQLQVLGSHQVNMVRKVARRRNIYLFDLSTFFPSKSLREVAETFGLKKLDYDVTNLSPSNLKDPDFMIYAKQDAWLVGEIGRRFRQMMLEAEGIDILLTRTPGSFASAMFRSRFIKDRLCQDWTLLRRHALRACHGGRKEAFYRGSKPLVFEYDGKSMYANIAQLMKVLPLPQHWQTTPDLATWLSARGGFGTVYFTYPDSCNRTDFKPDLPVECGDRLIFPLSGVSRCTTWEVKNAIAKGAHVTLDRGFYYNKGVTWLAEFEAEMIAKREAARGTALDPFYKLLSVAVIGKMCQKQEDYNLNDLVKYATDRGLPAHVFKGVVNLPIEKELKIGTLFQPEWYVLVLGAARANVAKAADITGALQIATDGVITTVYKGESFDVDGITYRLEAAGDYVAYRAGLYRLGKSARYHGASRDVAELILKDFQEVPSWTYETKRIATIKQYLQSGISYGKTVTQKRTVKLGFDGKRILLSSGETLPIQSSGEVIGLPATEGSLVEYIETKNKLREGVKV